MACQASSKTISLILQESTRAQEPKPKSIPYLDKCITGFSNDPCFSYWRGDPIIRTNYLYFKGCWLEYFNSPTKNVALLVYETGPWPH